MPADEPEVPRAARDSAAPARRSWLSRWAVLCWVASLVILLIVAWHPVSIGLARLAIVACSVALLVLPLVWLRRRPLLASPVAAVAAAALALAVWPPGGGPTTAAYLASLRRYDSVPYVWGGENGNGIDCSGLLRRAYVRA